MPIGDSSHQFSVVVHQHPQLIVFPELEPLADVFAASAPTGNTSAAPITSTDVTVAATRTVLAGVLSTGWRQYP
jgi:hypothetical protein